MVTIASRREASAESAHYIAAVCVTAGCRHRQLKAIGWQGRGPRVPYRARSSARWVLAPYKLRGAAASPGLGAQAEFEALALHGGASALFSFQKPYLSQLKINICQSSQHLQLLVSGSGLEPRLEFQPEVLELGPVLPSSPGAQGTVVVKNPCEFPIELYSLEFDQQYLAEEQVLLDLLDEEGAFFLKARPSTKCLSQAVGMEDSAGEERKLHTASLLLQCGQAAELEVLFKASLPQRLEGKLQLAVLDNPAGASTIRLLGAGCQEDFSLDNIQGLVAGREEENLPESSLEEDSLEALLSPALSSSCPQMTWRSLPLNWIKSEDKAPKA
ncbi:uncharacterized protein [Melanerpes formicivorus]|uniref:uncharacterized protein n=1 Tax=Melanerpes formicivorus TaxID=211600 RepID=UPI00358F2981